jgi:hypothetical protein
MFSETVWPLLGKRNPTSKALDLLIEYYGVESEEVLRRFPELNDACGMVVFDAGNTTLGNKACIIMTIESSKASEKYFLRCFDGGVFRYQ